MDSSKKYLLKDLCAIISGKSFKKVKKYSSSCLPVLQVKDLKDGKVDIENLWYVKSDNLGKTFTLVEMEDIVVANRGTIGKIGIDLTDLKLVVENNLFKLVPGKEINNKYLYHYLLCNSKKIEQLSKKNTGERGQLNRQSFQNFEIVMPSLKEQQKIAETLEILNELKLREKQYRYYRDHLINNPGGLLKNIYWVMFVKLFLELLLKRATIQKLELLS